MKAETDIRVHDTDPDLFAVLARVFGEKSAEGTRWVDIHTEAGVKIVLFAAGSGAPAHHLEELEL